MTHVKPEQDLINPRWKHPANIMVVGPAKSGKTEFVRKLLRHRQWIMDPPIKQVVYCYGIWQPGYDEIKREMGEEMVWVQGLPKDPYSKFTKTPGMLILDDLMTDMEKSPITSWFTKGTHHRDVTLVVLLQNMFAKNLRTASLNAHYIVMFSNPRDRGQVSRLVSQAFPGQMPWVRGALDELEPYEPLIMDFNQTTQDRHRLRADPFPEDLKEKKHPFTRVFLP